jgi:hypothetical protein
MSVVRPRLKTGVDGHVVSTASQRKAGRPTVTKKRSGAIAVAARVTVRKWGIAAAQTSRRR